MYYRMTWCMDKHIILGIDNGSSGSVGVRGDGFSQYIQVPTVEENDYVKEQRKITRLDVQMFDEFITGFGPGSNLYAYIERPLINPTMFIRSIHAARFFESTLCMLERKGIEWEVIDSRIWNRSIFSRKVDGEAALKQESFNVGLQLFPHLASTIIKQNDADGLLIAEYGYRVHTGTVTSNY